jgi:hypothetical protein
MKFESQQSDWEIDKERSKSLDKPWEKLAEDKADKIMEEKTPKLQNFKGLLEYVRDNIDEDREKVDELLEKFGENETNKKAKILEAMILDQGESWFGSDVKIEKTATFDDFINAVDLVLGEGELAVAVDVTYGSNIVEKKLERIKEEIDADKLRDIKYYRTFKNGVPKRCKLHQVPRIVIGMETNAVDNLSAAWVRGDSEYLKNSEVQYILLDQMETELRKMAHYSEQVGSKEAADKYNNALDIVEKILKTKEIPVGESDWLEDRVSKGIKRGLDNLFSILDSEEAA